MSFVVLTCINPNFYRVNNIVKYWNISTCFSIGTAHIYPTILSLRVTYVTRNYICCSGTVRCGCIFESQQWHIAKCRSAISPQHTISVPNWYFYSSSYDCELNSGTRYFKGTFMFHHGICGSLWFVWHLWFHASSGIARCLSLYSKSLFLGEDGIS